MNTTPLTTNPMATGAQEGFATEAEAIEVWNTLENKFEYSIKYIVSHTTGDTIAVVFEKCDPAKYKAYYNFGEII
jgi:hypothetical protein